MSLNKENVGLFACEYTFGSKIHKLQKYKFTEHLELVMVVTHGELYW